MQLINKFNLVCTNYHSFYNNYKVYLSIFNYKINVGLSIIIRFYLF